MTIPTDPPDSLLERAITAYLQEAEIGVVDREMFVGRYPAIVEELREFIENHERLLQLTTPLREMASAVAKATPRDDETLAYVPWRDAAQRLIGTQLGEYEILAELGRGGMGVVYQARHLRLNRWVALKMVLTGRFAGAQDIERFYAEAKSAATLDHSGIVPIYETGELQGYPFISMGYVEGRNLSEQLKREKLHSQVAARWIRKIALAVAYAHERGVIHRDLKPANILLAIPANSEADQELWEPRIADFGLAKRIGGEGQLTNSGQVLGTPSYMSPEQAAGDHRNTGAGTDVYGLGTILYSMLTGRAPFVADHPVEVILQVLEQEPESPRTIQADVPPELEAICLKCLEKKVEDRYQSAAEFVEDVDRFLRQEPPEAHSLTPWQRFRRWMRREPVFSWHMLVLGIIFLLIQAIYLTHAQSEWSYHWPLCGILAGWFSGSVLFRSLPARQRTHEWFPYVWIATDIFFLTWLLTQLVSPLGPLLSGYLLLICVAGLFFQTRLIAFTTAVSLLGYGLLLVLRPAEAEPWHYVVSVLRDARHHRHINGLSSVAVERTA